MAKGTFCEESTSWNRSRAADRHHDFGDRGRRVKRRRLRAGNSLERFDDRVLRGSSIRHGYHGVIFWAASREGICWRGSACSLLSAHTRCNLSACSRLDWESPTVWVCIVARDKLDSHDLNNANSGGEKDVLCLAAHSASDNSHGLCRERMTPF